MYFKVEPDKSGKFNWQLFGENHRMVAWSGQNFDTELKARREAVVFKVSARTATFDVYPDKSDEWRWRALVNGDNVASSGESFDSKSNAERAADNVQRNAGGATTP